MRNSRRSKLVKPADEHRTAPPLRTISPARTGPFAQHPRGLHPRSAPLFGLCPFARGRCPRCRPAAARRLRAQPLRSRHCRPLPGAHDQQRALLLSLPADRGLHGPRPHRTAHHAALAQAPARSAHARGGGTHSRLHRPLHARGAARSLPDRTALQLRAARERGVCAAPLRPLFRRRLCARHRQGQQAARRPHFAAGGARNPQLARCAG